MNAIDAIRLQAHIAHQGARLALAGLTHEDSLVAPAPAGNAPNWVLGHLLSVYDSVLPLLGQAPLRADGSLARYARGAPPLEHSDDAIPIDELLATLDIATERFDAGIASLSPEQLAAAVPNSPSGNPDETVESLLATIAFHQAYHVGQLGLLRRLAGRPAAFG